MAVIGESVPQVHGADKVTGAAVYTVNMELPGMVHARLLRSPHAHARLVHIDAARAERLPGVVAVLTRADLLAWDIDPYYGPVVHDQPIVAIDKVCYVGDVVAAVAAVDPGVAEAALELIEVEYEPLPHVMDPVEAMAPGAPRIHERQVPHATAFEDLKALHVGGDGEPNCCTRFRLRQGDVERGFAAADRVFEGVYRSPVQQHAHLEPHAVLARTRRDGCLEVWSSTQNPSVIRDALAGIFRLPLSKVRVMVPYVGAGYGAKTYPKLEPVTCALAKKAGRPVKLVLPREEVFLTVTKHACVVRLRTGVKADGTIVARQATAWYDTGAYADIGPRTSKNGGYAMGGPYRIPNLALDSYCVYTNKTPAGAFRGFGVTQVAWAYEQQMDEIARALGRDPLALRLANVVREGDAFATGETLRAVACDEATEAVARAIDWGTPKVDPRPGVRRGRGLATIIKSTMTPSLSSAICKLEEDGSLSVLTSSVEIGQGAETSLAQIAAETLALPFDRVQVIQPDTAATPYDQSTSSSRTTFSMGTAVARACAEIREQLVDAAAQQLEARPEDLACEAGHVVVRGAPERRLSYEDVLRRKFGMRVGGLVGRGLFKTEGGLDPETGQGVASAFWFTSACACEVEVDEATGHVRVVRLVGAGNAGRAINPRMCETQIEGAMGMALGLSLYEELAYDGGQPLNPNFLDYRLPTIVEAPAEIRAIVLEKPHPLHPYGAIGIGEAVLPPVAPAVANAVCDAVGARVRDLPITPEKVLRALREARGGSGGGTSDRGSQPAE